MPRNIFSLCFKKYRFQYDLGFWLFIVSFTGPPDVTLSFFQSHTLIELTSIFSNNHHHSILSFYYATVCMYKFHFILSNLIRYVLYIIWRNLKNGIHFHVIFLLFIYLTIKKGSVTFSDIPLKHSCMALVNSDFSVLLTTLFISIPKAI